ncbi:MAG TPA: hypothetical protein PKW69_12770, partial [Niabella sp.]|nr:hypothetical protein [Niabella sp.]
MKKTLPISPSESAFNPGLLIKSILDQSLHYEPDKEIFYRDRFSMNYRTLHERVAKLANALNAMGVGAGDVVGVLEFD